MKTQIALIVVLLSLVTVIGLGTRQVRAQALEGAALNECRVKNLTALNFIQKTIADPYCCEAETWDNRLLCLRIHVAQGFELSSMLAAIKRKSLGGGNIALPTCFESAEELDNIADNIRANEDMFGVCVGHINNYLREMTDNYLVELPDN